MQVRGGQLIVQRSALNNIEGYHSCVSSLRLPLSASSPLQHHLRMRSVPHVVLRVTRQFIQLHRIQLQSGLTTTDHRIHPAFHAVTEVHARAAIADSAAECTAVAADVLVATVVMVEFTVLPTSCGNWKNVRTTGCWPNSDFVRNAAANFGCQPAGLCKISLSCRRRCPCRQLFRALTWKNSIKSCCIHSPNSHKHRTSNKVWSFGVYFDESEKSITPQKSMGNRNRHVRIPHSLMTLCGVLLAMQLQLDSAAAGCGDYLHVRGERSASMSHEPMDSHHGRHQSHRRSDRLLRSESIRLQSQSLVDLPSPFSATALRDQSPDSPCRGGHCRDRQPNRNPPAAPSTVDFEVQETGIGNWGMVPCFSTSARRLSLVSDRTPDRIVVGVDRPPR